MTIHKEGRTLLFVLLVAFVALVWVADYFLFPEYALVRNLIIAVAVVFYLLILQFFRLSLIHI